MYTHQQVKQATLAYFNDNELATDIWMSKYALHTPDGNFLELTPDDMHRRLASEFARISAKFDWVASPKMSAYGQARKPLNTDKIYALFKNFEKVVPQGSIMSVLGDNNFVGSLSNCIVIDSPFDSYGGIMFTDQQLTQLMKRRAGVGLDISTLRPENAAVTNVAKTSTGAVSFMTRFSNTTREVAQNGRRGALMLTMDCRHPDIEKFITIKLDTTKVTGANISVMWTDDFLQAVENDSEYTLRWPVGVPVDAATVTKTIKARAIWDLAVETAHASAEPGMIFINRMRQYSTCHPYYPIVSTNPCGEIGMGANDSCRLIALNMFGAVRNPFELSANFDFDLWYKMVYEAMVLSDNLVELELEHIARIIAKIENDPEPDYIKATELQTWQKLYANTANGRRTGLGFTALGDTLAALDLKYDAAQTLVEHIMRTKMEAEWDATIDMAITRGVFPDYTFKPTQFTDMLAIEAPHVYERLAEHGQRNVSLSTVAPTGSVSFLAKIGAYHGTTSGMEPLFAPWYTKRKKINPSDTNVKVDFTDATGDQWQHYKVFHSGLQLWADVVGVETIEKHYPKSPYYGATAAEINWLQRVAIQAIIQKYVTHSISSTINLPANVTPETVGAIYMHAHKQGLKGVTVYVAGSRDGVLITEKTTKVPKTDAPKRPTELPAKLFNIKYYGNWVVAVGYLGADPFEIFAFKVNTPLDVDTGTLVKLGGGIYNLVLPDNTTIENITQGYNGHNEAALTRLMSGALRHGMSIKFMVEQLGKTEDSITSFPKVIYRTLQKLLPVGVELKGGTCPDCGSTLVAESGCFTCPDCGFSKCA